MLQILYTFLIQQRELFLPGMGNLRVVTSDPGYDVVHQTLRPAVVSIALTKEQSVGQKTLFAYIAKKLECSELEAMQAFNACVFEMRQKLKGGETILWERVGMFSAGDNIAEVRLNPVVLEQQYREAVPAIVIIRKEKQHPVLVGDEETHSHDMQERLIRAAPKQGLHWGWIAVILTVIGLAFLAYHTSNVVGEKENTSRTPGAVIGNRQPVIPR